MRGHPNSRGGWNGNNRSRGVQGYYPRGRGSGGAGGRGRGRGQAPYGWGGGYHTLEEMGDVYLVAENFRPTTPQGGLQRRGGFQPPYDPRTSSRGAPEYGGRGRGFSDDLIFSTYSHRGRGGVGNRNRGNYRRGGRPDAPLSMLLNESRPLLKPVKFVPSVFTHFLFQDEEEIFKPFVQDVGKREQDDVPTADRVFRVFSGGNVPRLESPSSEAGTVEDIEEIDFEDMARIHDIRERAAEVEDLGERLSSVSIDPTPATLAKTSHNGPLTAATDAGHRVRSKDDVKTDVEVVQHISTVHGSGIHSVANGNDSHNISKGTPASSSLAVAAAQDSQASLQSGSKHPPPEDIPNPDQPVFFIDTDPSPLPSDISAHLPQPPRIPSPPPILPESDEEEVIVYVAPHPRLHSATEQDASITPSSVRVSPAPPLAPCDEPTPAVPSTSILTGVVPTPAPPSFTSVSFSRLNAPQILAKAKAGQTTSVGVSKALLRKRVQEARAKKKRKEREEKMVVMFDEGGGGGVRGDIGFEGRDPRWEERRRGDSDVDWGSEDGEDESVGGEGVAEGMEVDPELVDGNEDAMRKFADGVLGAGAGTWETMDDIERMKDEDEGEEKEGGSTGSEDNNEDEDDDEDGEEMDEAVYKDEVLMMGDGVDFDGLDQEDEEAEDVSVSEDEGDSPSASFQARLERIRKISREKGKGKGRGGTSISVDEEEYVGDKADKDEDYIAHIQEIIDQNEELINGRDRKARNKLFNAIRDGDFDDLEDDFLFKPARKGKKKHQDLPEALQAQWEKDRQKKAEQKKKRQLERLRVEAESPFMKKINKNKDKDKDKKNGKKEDGRTPPDSTIDMTTLVQQIRGFLADEWGPKSMALPPTSKTIRKDIHELAKAFGLESQSKGSEDARFTTLYKMRNGQKKVKEGKIAKILRRYGRVGRFSKEGDEVGKAAPKIGVDNVGFRMLSLMGWTEGERIGISSEGLDAPITAVIKHSKLGLGATRS